MALRPRNRNALTPRLRDAIDEYLEEPLRFPSLFKGWMPRHIENAGLRLFLKDVGVQTVGQVGDSGSTAKYVWEGNVEGTITAGDATAPSGSPAPTVRGAISFLMVEWDAQANDDPVTYEVHVSTSTGFTPSALTLHSEVDGTIAVIRALPDGTALAYSTDYFVKIVAKDIDGSAAASTQGTAQLVQVNSADIAVNAVIAEKILAGEITAEKLESVLTLTSTLLAGTDGASRVEIGLLQGGGIGLVCFASDGTTTTFRLDAQTGDVYVKGRVDFGTGSRLLAEDIVEIGEQPAGAFQTPTLVQSAGDGDAAALSGSASWPSPTTAGNLLLLVATTNNTVTHTTPSGWTLVGSSVNSGLRTSLYKIESSASRSGSQAVSFSGSSDSAIQLFEYSGAGVEDQSATNSGTWNGTITAPTTGTTGTTTQNDELWFAAIANNCLLTGANHPQQSNPTNSFAEVRSQTDFSGTNTVNIRQHVYGKNVSATGTASMGVTLSNPGGTFNWNGIIVTFKAKAVGVETPGADKVRVYAKEVASASRLHTTDDAGTESAVVLGAPNEVWRMEHVRCEFNLLSTAAHTSAADLDFTSVQSAQIGNVAIGDLIIFLGFETLADTPPGSFIFVPEAVATQAGHIKMRVYNAHTGTVDPGLLEFEFLVIHRN